MPPPWRQHLTQLPSARKNQVSSTESGFSDTVSMPSSINQRARSGGRTGPGHRCRHTCQPCGRPDSHGQISYRRITLVKQVGNDAGVTVQAQSQLGHVVGTDGNRRSVPGTLGQQGVEGNSHIAIRRSPFSPRLRPNSRRRPPGLRLACVRAESSVRRWSAHFVAHFFIARHSSSKQSRKLSLM